MNLLPLPPLTELTKKRISGDYNLIFESSIDENNHADADDANLEMDVHSEPGNVGSLSKNKNKSVFASFKKAAPITPEPSPSSTSALVPTSSSSLSPSSSSISNDGSLSARFLLNRQVSREQKASISDYISAIHAAKIIKLKAVGSTSSPSIKKAITDNLFDGKQVLKLRNEKKKLKFKRKCSDDGDDSSSDSSDSDEDDYENGIDRNREMSQDDLEFSNQHPRGNCRFAAGYTIPKPFVAAFCSMVYYTPGFLELIDALLNPAEYDQTSIPWLFKIPRRYDDQEYCAVARELLQAGTLPLGLLRPGGIHVGTPFPYVVTLVPSSTVIVSSDDSIYVLADPTWANEQALKLGFYSSSHKARKKTMTTVSSMFSGTTPKKMPFLNQSRLSKSLNVKS